MAKVKKGFIEKGVAGVRKFQAWIDKNTSADPERVRGQCRGKAEAMAAAFPELRVVGYVCYFTQHAWCVNKKNQVVDPTAHQFGGHGYSYPKKRFLELTDFPTGKCPECGELIWPDTEGAREFNTDDEDCVIGEHTVCWENFNRYMEEEYGEWKDGK